MSETTGGGNRRGGSGGGHGFFDDLAGVASGAFSALAGVRAEVEAMARSQAEALVQRLDLVKREELDAVLEVARRAREGQEALEGRVAALEARLGELAPLAAAAAQAQSVVSPPPPPTPGEPPLSAEARTEAAPDGL
jgi:BMFP domain-containing protein YqiC